MVLGQTMTSAPGVASPKQPTIGVAIIARNAGKTLYHCIKSFESYIDQIVVVLAGKSEDDTAIQAKRASKKVELYDFEWVDDFSAARNFAFSYIKTDWVLWLDSDDVMEGADQLPDIVKNVSPEIGGVWFPYFYAFDDQDNCTTLFIRERLLRMSIGWIWRGRVHETVSPIMETKYMKHLSVAVIHKHMEHGGSRAERNFKLLNMMSQENPEDRRVWMYLGFQHFAGMDWENAAEWFIKCANDDKMLPIEKYQCLTYAGRALRMAGKFPDAIKADLMAVEINPMWADGYIGLCQAYTALNNWNKGIYWGELAFNKTPPDQLVFNNPLDYSFNVYMALAGCYINIFEFDKALTALEQCQKVRPKDAGVLDQIKRAREAKFRKDATQGLENIYMALVRDGDWAKASMLKYVLPEWLRHDANVRQLVTNIEDKVRAPDKVVSELTEEQKKWIKDQMAKYGEGYPVYNLETAFNPQVELQKAEEQANVCFVTIGHQKDGKIRHITEPSLEIMLTEKPGKEILTIHEMENGCIGATYRKGNPKTKIARIFLGQGLEKWSPETMEHKGCGGSETVMANIAGELQKQDYQAILYGMVDGVYHGVRYRMADKFTPNGCNIFISSRIPEIFESPIEAETKILWLHDVHRGERITPHRIENIDYIVVLSKWHAWYTKQCYPFLSDCEVIDLGNPTTFVEDGCPASVFHKDDKLFKKPKIIILNNAINTEYYEDMSYRKRDFRFIWSSSPDRGLYELLRHWPKIKTELPKAQLHIFYGWEYFDFTLGIPHQRKIKEEIQKMLIMPGVHWRGRVGQKQLATEFKMADVWFYPLHYSDILNKDAGGFRETFCISAVEAQAANCLCIARASGGLGESVSDRGVLIPLDAGKKELDYLFGILYDKTRQTELRGKGREWAMKQTYANALNKLLEVVDGTERGHTGGACP